MGITPRHLLSKCLYQDRKVGGHVFACFFLLGFGTVRQCNIFVFHFHFDTFTDGQFV